ncbi:stage III sporulation protein AG [Bacillus sp. LL01]|uniref:stage III sporulation protein AG n=1 Tax=Bacillus sp. LL01 TaxID=1665556 RepID=UPI00064D7057|nr:stage III sporulation protein AG [Bacillus sp. LL01]KMJ60013.1 stage III sporulation protein AG [Bacillus sp. LL01]
MEKKNQAFIPWLKSLLSNQSKDKKAKYQYMTVVLVLGVGFMLFGTLFFGEESASSPGGGVLPAMNQQETEDEEVFGHSDDANAPSTISDYEASFENQLKEALEGIIGVNDVSVVVNIDASEKKVFQINKTTSQQTTVETDKQGGERNVTDSSQDEQVLVIRKNEQEIPVVSETKKPVIRGVLVVAKGAENIHVKQMILEAVTRVLDVPQHKVAILPKKSEGE